MPQKKAKKPTREIEKPKEIKTRPASIEPVIKRLKINQIKLTAKQKKYLQIMTHRDTNIAMLQGAAGTSKTYLAVLAAIELLKSKSIDQVLYVRSIVECARNSLGSLPGEIEDKFGPFMMPLQDKLNEIIVDDRDVNKILSFGIVQAMPVNYIRGASLRNTCIIVDEAQNLDISELEVIYTRLGEGSKLFVCGDCRQADIGNKRSGFRKIYDKFEEDKEAVNNGVFNCKFDIDDIVRSEFLKYVVPIFDIIKSED